MNYLKRTEAIVGRMQEEHLDWLIVSNLKNIRYLSGFTGSHAMLLIGPDKRYIVTDGRYDEQVRFEVKNYEPVIQGQRKELEAAHDTLGDISSQRLGFEAEHVSYARVDEIKAALPAADYLPKRGWVEELRMVKDAEEIEIIRKALRIAEESLQSILVNMEEGISERELAHRLEDEMWRRGAEQKSFDTIVLFGARSSLPHGKPSENKLKAGDIVLMDFGCIVQGYCSDITRTVFFGKPTDEQKAMYDCVHQAQRNAERNLRAGLHSKDSDELARSVIRNAGRENEFMHGLGHGVGLDIHEAPRLSNLANHTMAPGHVVTIEPGVYIAGVGGIRIENMAVIKEKNCEVLNQSSTEMMIL